jgi:hypothetical protein
MSIVMADTDRWLVSTRAHGEVLTTHTSTPGLQLWLLGAVEGFQPDDLERWLETVARAVSESADPEPGDPVSPLLRAALEALLFSRAELWNRGTPPCAVALAATPKRIGLGWVGDASVDVHHEGPPTDSEWVSIRDGSGREARAWCGDPSQGVRAELTWAPGEPTGLLQMEARWTHGTPVPARENGVESALEMGEAADPGASPPETRGAELQSPPLGAPSAGVARWLEQHLRWNRPESDRTDPQGGTEAPVTIDAEGKEPEPVVDDIVSAIAAEITERLEADARSFAAPEAPPVEPSISEPDESEADASEPDASAADASETDASETDASEIDASEPEPTLEEAPPPSPFVPEPQPRSELRPPRPPRHPDWPEDEVSEESSARRNWLPLAIGSIIVLALFGVGWFAGSNPGGTGPEEARKPSALVLFLRRIGLAPPRYQVAVTSRPPGAWIAIDGKDLSIRAPASLELAPGEHKVELSFGDLGGAPYLVRGAKDDKVSLDAPLWGSLDVVATDARANVEVALDGQPLGFVPIRLDSVAPGPHDLRFTAPGMGAWGSTIEVRVGERREVLAYPLQSPATGLLQVRATQSSEGETAPLDGAKVWVDAIARGVTPLTLELSRGPHSVRVSHQKDDAPIQVIDLPGGNQRFATFDFGLRSDLPALVLKAPAQLTIEEPALISATLSETGTVDVREMWLHVRSPENRWRRYPMTLLDAQGSVVGAAPFPIVLLGPDGTQLYYVSAMTAQGDEIFTEMQTARGPKPQR